MSTPTASTPTPVSPHAVKAPAKDPATTTPPAVKAPVPATAVPQMPAKDPATTAPTAAKGDDDVMSQHKKPS